MAKYFVYAEEIEEDPEFRDLAETIDGGEFYNCQQAEGAAKKLRAKYPDTEKWDIYISVINKQGASAYWTPSRGCDCTPESW